MDQRPFEEAIRRSWAVRDAQAAKKLLSGRTDTGGRVAVTGGAHLDDLTELLANIFLGAGFPAGAVRSRTGVSCRATTDRPRNGILSSFMRVS